MANVDENSGRIALIENSPRVDLQALILENNGVQIDSHPGMGRIITATERFCEDRMYQSVLRELPALVCRQQDYMNFMENFLDIPLELQVGILDMFFQPLDSAMGKALVEPAKTLFLLGVLEDFTVIHQLLSILMTNGHQYRQNFAAIPLFGSKFSHSCDPNIGYSSDKSSDGAVEYKLLRPVEKGEILSFSYLSDLVETPTNERRQLLLETKSFLCSCTRCNGPDYCRCLRCPTCPTLLPCQYTSDSFEEYWECSKCGIVESEILLIVERSYAKTLEIINRGIEKQNDFDSYLEYSPSVLEELMLECEKELSPTHHLTIKASRLLFTTSTAHAYVQIKKMMVRGLPIASRRAFSFFRTSVLAGYRLVLAGECVAVGCTGCIDEDLRPKHAPNYDRALVMRHVCDNILQIPVCFWPPQTVVMTTRYMPILRARYDNLVDYIEKAIIKDMACLECGTYWDAFTCQTTPSLKAMDERVIDNPTSPTKPLKKSGNNKKRSNKKKKRRK